MADESEDRTRASSVPGAEWALSAAGRDMAEAYLKEQIRLARLQANDLEREDNVRHWSLRVHHVSDVMKLAFEFAMAAILMAIVAIIAGAVWSAAHDSGAVIEAFKVPPDMAAKGLTGDVVASQLLDRLTDMQAHINSARAPATYGSNFGEDIKVEIPNTGISISEAYRYLVGWLGHQTHISGEVFRTPAGIALTVRTSGNPGVRFDGSEADLDKLVGRAAESIYSQTQPFRYAVFLLNHSRLKEADGALRNLALNGPPSERPWAYAIWMYLSTGPSGESEMLARAHEAAALDPQNLLAEDNAATADATAGHDEDELRYAVATRNAYNGGGRREVRENAALIMGQQGDIAVAELLGDYRAASKLYAALESEPDFTGSQWTSHYMQAVDDAKAHDPQASQRDLGSYTDQELFPLSSVGSGYNLVNLDFPQFQRLATLGQWQLARKDLEGALATKEARDIGQFVTIRSQALPWLALADAKSGDLASARGVIAKTITDCYLCLRVRGDIEAIARNWSGADYWYAAAVKAAPSIPFAYADWGAMLMSRGDLAGAIAKFQIANQKGPHFADPLEMWGEALVRENRSDLALPKFEEANKYAPNWGRLHLKWGEALLWTGDKDGAAKQFALAGTLDLTPAEKSELERMRSAHG